jgi:hypothetical protein
VVFLSFSLFITIIIIIIIHGPSGELGYLLRSVLLKHETTKSGLRYPAKYLSYPILSKLTKSNLRPATCHMAIVNEGYNLTRILQQSHPPIKQVAYTSPGYGVHAT